MKWHQYNSLASLRQSAIQNYDAKLLMDSALRFQKKCLLGMFMHVARARCCLPDPIWFVVLQICLNAVGKVLLNNDPASSTSFRLLRILSATVRMRNADAKSTFNSGNSMMYVLGTDHQGIPARHSLPDTCARAILQRLFGIRTLVTSRLLSLGTASTVPSWQCSTWMRRIHSFAAIFDACRHLLLVW
jgi:hypothetical protein